MHERTLGRTDIRLSEISLGTWGLGAESYGPVARQNFERTVEQALDSGVTTFDMAPLWGDGRAEEVVGEATRARRDEVVYITRAGRVWDDGSPRERFDEASLRACCERSLERLGTDRIDVWLLHNPSTEILEGQGFLGLVEALKSEGKIRSFGVSVASPEAARLALAAGAEVLCLPYNIFAADLLDDLGADLDAAGCGVLACSPLCHGLLAGRWTERRSFVESDHRGSRWNHEALVARIRTVNQLRFLVRDEVKSLSAAALRFVLSAPHVASAVVGARTPPQVRDATRNVGEPPYLSSDDLFRIPQILAAAGT